MAVKLLKHVHYEILYIIYIRSYRNLEQAALQKHVVNSRCSIN